MTGLTQYTATAVLNHVTGGVAIFPLPSVYMGLFSAVGTDDGTGFTEPSGNNYARVQVSGFVLTNAGTAIGDNILNLASVPTWAVVGMYVYDVTTLGAIPANTKITSVAPTTITLNNSVTGTGVASGDQIVFTAFNSASGVSPSSVNNSATITFPAPSGSWGTILAWGLFDQPSSGNLLVWDYLGSFDWLPVEVSNASPAVLTAKGNGYSAADSFVYSTEYGGTAPTFSAGSFTGVLTVQSPSTDTFTAKNGATVVNTLSTGSGMVRKIMQSVIDNTSGSPSFIGGNPGGLVLSLA